MSSQGVAQQFAGRVLRQCQPDQGAMASTWQKATAPLSSTPGTAGTAARTALVGTRCQCGVAAVGEHSCGSVEELLYLGT